MKHIHTFVYNVMETNYLFHKIKEIQILGREREIEDAVWNLISVSHSNWFL